MFCGLSNLTELDISNFDTSNVTTMLRMFYNDSQLKTIYVGNKWDISNLISDDSQNEEECGSIKMFTANLKIVGGSGTTYDANHTDKSYAHIDGGPSNPGYLTLKTN